MRLARNDALGCRLHGRMKQRTTQFQERPICETILRSSIDTEFSVTLSVSFGSNCARCVRAALCKSTSVIPRVRCQTYSDIGKYLASRGIHISVQSGHLADVQLRNGHRTLHSAWLKTSTWLPRPPKHSTCLSHAKLIHVSWLLGIWALGRTGHFQTGSGTFR